MERRGGAVVRCGRRRRRPPWHLCGGPWELARSGTSSRIRRGTVHARVRPKSQRQGRSRRAAVLPDLEKMVVVVVTFGAGDRSGAAVQARNRGALLGPPNL
uniref:Uncharacterized protein n=1 Tax=Arundo donax TaxID=35708 RepID=A0A0A8ZX29_ARUDO